MRYGKWKVRYHLKCCVIVNALIECKITFFKVVRQSLKVFYIVTDTVLKNIVCFIVSYIF